jgi:hypothetical protein
LAGGAKSLKKFNLIMDKSQTFPSPLTGEGKGEGENILTPLTLILPHKGGGNFLCCLPVNSKGISVVFLVIAMMLMVTIGYVFSYLIPTKQKSVRFPIYSTQAFYIAQSGVEFAIRYSSDQGWRGATDNVFDLNRLDGISKPLGNGTFTINYNNATGDILTSTGQVTGSSENRVLQVSNFTPFLRLIFDPASAAPTWTLGTRRARFFFRNVRQTNITLTGFAASWNSGVVRTITRINLDGNQKYAGAYSSDSDLSPPAPFNRGGNSETVVPNEVITVLVYWSGNTSATNIIIKFFDNTGEGYTFNLDPEGDGL